MPSCRNKYPLTTQTTKLFIVIRKNKRISKDLIKSYCNEFFKEYSFIEHSKDIDAVTGVVIPVHYHIVGESLKKRTPLSTHLNDLRKYFRFETNDGIQIDKYDSYISALQYLIHKNNKEKTQHSIDEVVTNIPREEFLLYMTSDTTEIISFDMIYKFCMESHNRVELIRSIGFKTYARYRSTINDIFNVILEERERKKKRNETSNLFS